ncbi:unnamed protein product [Symbiodinium microadriaticum]|nr:unnamed protein product [Symbiodinium microadriaticum]
MGQPMERKLEGEAVSFFIYMVIIHILAIQSIWCWIRSTIAWLTEPRVATKVAPSVGGVWTILASCREEAAEETKEEEKAFTAPSPIRTTLDSTRWLKCRLCLKSTQRPKALLAMAPKTAPKAKAAAAKADPKPKAEGKAKAKVKKEEQEDDKPKVPQPNKEEFDAKSEKIQEEINKLQDKQKKLTEKIQERSGGKEEFYAKKAELRAQLDVITDKINGLMEKKDEINKAVGNKREEGREMRSQLNSMKKTVGFTSQQEINNRIATIEFQLCTESVPLKEEKKLLAEIQTLKKNRSKVDTMNTMEQNLANFDPGMSMKEQKDAINADIAQFRDEKKKIQDQMTELSEARKTQLGPIEEIQNERNAIGEKLRAKFEERNALRDEYRQQEREYWAYQQELRKARQERYAAEKAEKQKEYDLRRKQREAEKLDEQPYVAEITLIEQTIKYCKGLVQSKTEEKKDEKKEVEYNNPDGAEILLRKEDRDEEFYFAPTKAGKKGKNKNKGLFDQLKLDAPLSTEQVPALLEELEKHLGQSSHFGVETFSRQLGEFQGKVKEWEEKREDMKKAILEGLNEIAENKAAREAEEKDDWRGGPGQDFGNFQDVQQMSEVYKERQKFGRFYYRFPNGEAGTDVFDRVSDFWSSLLRSMDANPVENLVLVSHGLLMRIFCMVYFHWTVEEFEQVWNPSNCEVWALEKGQGSYNLAGRWRPSPTGGSFREIRFGAKRNQPLWNHMKCRRGPRVFVVPSGDERLEDPMFASLPGNPRRKDESNAAKTITGAQYRRKQKVLEAEESIEEDAE